MSICFDPDNYYPASYKGIQFNTIAVTSLSGRRGSTGEFVYSNTIAYQDLGKKAEEFTITGFFAGDDFLDKIKALTEACREEGAGFFVHPIYGEWWTSCFNLTQTSNIRTSFNMVKFTLTLVEVSKERTFNDVIRHIINLDFNNLIDDVLDIFKVRFNTNTLRRFWVEDTQTKISDLMKFLQHSFKDGVISTKKYGIINELQNKLDSGLNIDNAESIANLIKNSTNLIDNMVSDLPLKLGKFKDLITFASVDQQYSNPLNNVLYTTIRMVSTLKIAEVYTKNVPNSIQDVFKYIESVSNIFNNEIEIQRYLNDSEMLSKTISIQTEVINYFYKELYNTKQIKNYSFSGAVLPIVAAWEIYGDSNKVDEIRSLNNITGMILDKDVNARI